MKKIALIVVLCVLSTLGMFFVSCNSNAKEAKEKIEALEKACKDGDKEKVLNLVKEVEEKLGEAKLDAIDGGGADAIEDAEKDEAKMYEILKDCKCVTEKDYNDVIEPIKKKYQEKEDEAFGNEGVE